MVKLAILFPGRRLADHNGPRGMKTSKSLSLRETADTTRQASAPAADHLLRTDVCIAIRALGGMIPVTHRPSVQ